MSRISDNPCEYGGCGSSQTWLICIPKKDGWYLVGRKGHKILRNATKKIQNKSHEVPSTSQ